MDWKIIENLMSKKLDIMINIFIFVSKIIYPKTGLIPPVMDIKEKRILVSLVSSVAIMAIYCFCVYYRFIHSNPALLHDLRFLGKWFLIMVPVAIVAQIIIQILLAIYLKVSGHDDIDPIEDERDKMIELKAIKISHYIFIIGFMMAMGSLGMGMKPSVMIFVLMIMGFLASVVNEVLRLWYYRKGV